MNMLVNSSIWVSCIFSWDTRLDITCEMVEDTSGSYFFLKREVYRYPLSDSRDPRVNSREANSPASETPAGHPGQEPTARGFTARQRTPWVSLQKKRRPLVFLWKVWHLKKSAENSRIWLNYIGLGYVISLRGRVDVLRLKKKVF